MTKNLKIDSETPDSDPESSALLNLLGAKVRLFRSQRGMTRKGLAEQSGVSIPHLARLESNQGNASVLVLAKIAKALNVPLTSLLSGEDQNAGDLALLMEFLRRQPAPRLAEIRQQLFASDEKACGARRGRIALVGLRGAGKSVVGRLLAQRLKRPFIELNAEVEREAGMNLQEILNLYGQTGYRRLERNCLERIARTQTEVVLATGGGLVAEPSSYELLLSHFTTIWLRASPEAHFNRVLNQHDVRIASPELHAEAMDNIKRTLEARDQLYRMADLEIDTSGLNENTVANRILTTITGRPAVKSARTKP